MSKTGRVQCSAAVRQDRSWGFVAGGAGFRRGLAISAGAPAAHELSAGPTGPFALRSNVASQGEGTGWQGLAPFGRDDRVWESTRCRRHPRLDPRIRGKAGQCDAGGPSDGTAYQPLSTGWSDPLVKPEDDGKRGGGLWARPANPYPVVPANPRQTLPSRTPSILIAHPIERGCDRS